MAEHVEGLTSQSGAQRIMSDKGYNARFDAKDAFTHIARCLTSRGFP